MTAGCGALRGTLAESGVRGKGVQGASPSPSSRAGSGGARLGLAGPRGAEAGLGRPKGQMAAASGLWWARSAAPLACYGDRLPRGCAAPVRDPGPSGETWGWGRGPSLDSRRRGWGWRMNEGGPAPALGVRVCTARVLGAGCTCGDLIDAGRQLPASRQRCSLDTATCPATARRSLIHSLEEPEGPQPAVPDTFVEFKHFLCVVG